MDEVAILAANATDLYWGHVVAGALHGTIAIAVATPITILIRAVLELTIVVTMIENIDSSVSTGWSVESDTRPLRDLVACVLTTVAIGATVGTAS